MKNFPLPNPRANAREAAGARGLFFTVDALLSLALISVAAVALLAYTEQPAFYPKGAVALETLARDFAVQNSTGVQIDHESFYGLTALNLTLDNTTIPLGASAPRIAVRGVVSTYADSCCSSINCGPLTETQANGCLNKSNGPSNFEAWVFTK